MLILVNPRCVDCGAELNNVVGALVIEWPKIEPGMLSDPEIDLDQPALYMQCKNRAACEGRQPKETTE